MPSSLRTGVRDFPERWWVMVDVERIRSVVAPVVEGMGLEVVKIVWGREGRSRTLRIDVDRKRPRGPVAVPYEGSGLSSRNLSEASVEISAALDAYDAIQGTYVLQVSTPGLNRPLLNAQDFSDFEGHEIEVTLSELHEGRRRLKGTNRGLKDHEGDEFLVVEEDGERKEVPLSLLREANLVFGGLASGPPGSSGGAEKRGRKRGHKGRR